MKKEKKEPWLYRFWTEVTEDDTWLGPLVMAVLIGLVASIAFFVVTGPTYIIPAIVIVLGMGEWTYLSFCRVEKKYDTNEFVLNKVQGLLSGIFFFMMATIVYWMGYGTYKLIPQIDWCKTGIVVLCILGAIALIVGYFKINLWLGKKVMRK